MAVPTPYDFTAGQKMSATLLDAGVRDPLTYLLTNYPRVHAYSAASMSFSNATARVVNFDTEVYDTDSMHSTSSNTSRITATTAGLYEFHWFMRMPSATYTTFDMDIRLNANASTGGGSSIFPSNMPFASGSTFRLVSFHYTQFMNANDYHEMFFTQTTGGALSNIVGQFMTFVQARWIATV